MLGAGPEPERASTNWPLQVAGGAVVLGLGASVAGFLAIYNSIPTGDANLDRWGIRGRIAFRTLLTFGPKAIFNPDIGRALMGIVHQESRGNPNNYLGDTTISKCPSIGPMQICRATAIQYGLVDPSETYDDYAARAQDEAEGIRWGVIVFKHKYDEHAGDIVAATKAYNGSGPMADTYVAQVQQYTASKYA